MRHRSLLAVTLLILSGVLLAPRTGVDGASAAPNSLEDFPAPVDPQSWVLPAWMTWDDYVGVPGIDWRDPEHQPARKIRAALILGDFADRDFIVTMPEGSDIFGLDGVHNPIGVGSIPREEVGDFYNRFLITEPQELNHFHTVNDYWLEDSYGLVGVDSESFGPYRMDHKEHEYGLGGSDAGRGADSCPTGDTCGRNFDAELIQKSLADVTAGIALNGEDYDFRWLLHAGYDESGVWQEFGEMLFPNKESVNETFGNPDPTKPNWSETRYIEWSSFAASEGIWSHAVPGVTSTQGENDGQGVFGHELSHIFGVLDNYNNPYGDPLRRAYSGPWDMLSRGSFNGPGGSHNRWQIPPTLGATMPAHHMLRNKIRLGFSHVGPAAAPGIDARLTTRSVLAETGPLFTDIYPRAYPLAPVSEDVGLHGVQVVLDGGDRSNGSCSTSEQYDCDGGSYNNYTIEVVDRIGHDSFTPDHGVLLAKTKNVDTSPFIWVIDSHPEDINDVTAPPPNEDRDIYDFIRPGSGEKARISLGDYRQLADGLFHAGTGEGVVHEYVDEANALHIYVLGTDVDDRGVRTYRVAVRSLEGAGPASRGLEAGSAGAAEARRGDVAVVTCPITNTGSGTDLVRLAATSGTWRSQLQYEVIEVGAGETSEVPVYVEIAEDANAPQAVTLTATSETDPDATATCAGEVRVLGAGGGTTGTSTGSTTTTGTDTSSGTATGTATTTGTATGTDTGTAPTGGGPTPATGGGFAAGAVGLLGLGALAARRRAPRLR